MLYVVIIRFVRYVCPFLPCYTSVNFTNISCYVIGIVLRSFVDRRYQLFKKKSESLEQNVQMKNTAYNITSNL